MKVNFTKVYRTWHILTAISAFGIFASYLLGYSLATNTWNSPFLLMHRFFIVTLISAVFTRLYMAFSKINAVPMVHLFRAKNSFERVVALFYISMCSALLVVLFSDLYILLSTKETIEAWILNLRDKAIFAFIAFIALHVLYVIYHNKVHNTKTIQKLFLAKDS